MSELGRLSTRKREVARLVGEGCHNRQIADRLFICEQTVKNHISDIYQRLKLPVECDRRVAVARMIWMEEHNAEQE